MSHKRWRGWRGLDHHQLSATGCVMEQTRGRTTEGDGGRLILLCEGRQVGGSYACTGFEPDVGFQFWISVRVQILPLLLSLRLKALVLFFHRISCLRTTCWVYSHFFKVSYIWSFFYALSCLLGCSLQWAPGLRSQLQSFLPLPVSPNRGRWCVGWDSSLFSTTLTHCRVSSTYELCPGALVVSPQSGDKQKRLTQFQRPGEWQCSWSARSAIFFFPKYSFYHRFSSPFKNLWWISIDNKRKSKILNCLFTPLFCFPLLPCSEPVFKSSQTPC